MGLKSLKFSGLLIFGMREKNVALRDPRIKPIIRDSSTALSKSSPMTSKK
jgi:hypothetical protein